MLHLALPIPNHANTSITVQHSVASKPSPRLLAEFAKLLHLSTYHSCRKRLEKSRKRSWEVCSATQHDTMHIYMRTSFKGRHGRELHDLRRADGLPFRANMHQCAVRHPDPNRTSDRSSAFHHNKLSFNQCAGLSPPLSWILLVVRANIETSASVSSADRAVARKRARLRCPVQHGTVQRDGFMGYDEPDYRTEPVCQHRQ